MSNTERQLEALMQPHLRAAWEAGFYAGQQFGQAYEQFDPNRDSEYDAPSPVSNPYVFNKKENT